MPCSACSPCGAPAAVSASSSRTRCQEAEPCCPRHLLKQIDQSQGSGQSKTVMKKTMQADIFQGREDLLLVDLQCHDRVLLYSCDLWVIPLNNVKLIKWNFMKISCNFRCFRDQFFKGL